MLNEYENYINDYSNIEEFLEKKFIPERVVVKINIKTGEKRYFFIGLSEIITPIMEPTELFVRGVGDGSDIVKKEMYSFKDKGETNITLRPEGTAAVTRSYVV